MPTDQAELHIIMQGFYDIANFPNIVGAIDGTHVRIKSPSTDEHLYVNRKNYHSINQLHQQYLGNLQCRRTLA
jgi:hypothetical protein